MYFQNVVTLRLWQNTQFTTAILFFFIFTALGAEYNVIVRDSETIRLLESPRSMSVYILNTYIYIYIYILITNEDRKQFPFNPPIFRSHSMIFFMVTN